jgi:hypothetical protein
MMIRNELNRYKVAAFPSLTVHNYYCHQLHITYALLMIICRCVPSGCNLADTRRHKSEEHVW